MNQFEEEFIKKLIEAKPKEIIIFDEANNIIRLMKRR